jgi:perosamine synthetase
LRKHVVTTTSGTSALFVAIVAAGVKPGDEVLVPDITFIATANAVTRAGATPVLVDVDPDSLTISPQAAALAVTERTRAIILFTSAAALPTWMHPRSGRMRNDLAVVEDAAEAFMSRATHKGDFLGTIGDAGCFFVSPNKIITNRPGLGAVVSNDDEIAAPVVREFERSGPRLPVAKHAADADLHPTVGIQLQGHERPGARPDLGRLDHISSCAERRMREIYDRYVTGLREHRKTCALRIPPTGSCPLLERPCSCRGTAMRGPFTC